MRKQFGGLVLALGLCASGLLAIGAAHAQQGFVDIRDEGEILSHWLPDGSLLLPPYPPQFAGSDEQACVNLGYYVDQDGRTSNFVLLKAWGERTADDAAGRQRLDAFAQSAAAAVNRWRFAPIAGAGGKRRPMFTSATFAFSRDPAANRRELRGRCAVGDLRDFVQLAWAEAQARGNLRRAEADRHRQQVPELNTHNLRGPRPIRTVGL